MFSFRATVVVKRAPVATRSIMNSSRLQTGGSHMSDDDPNILEREKRRILHEKHDDTRQPHKKHAPGWSEPLASHSEANIKADQADTGSPLDLQKSTTDYIKKLHHAEDVVADVTETVSNVMHKAADKVSEALPGTTSNEKDEVGGPLGRKK
ncbi:hypothetical protein FRB94_005444 [Tulasnella sp. JGI-2019a]|nr:hypothetical protein FRB93_006175 [Tulasnella sp. JGI-2019a]KAG9000431.1 hypothetical protein FRB94_005444 [Tulasnella sp. JGI-2019a]